jgi:hypothetical protein
MGGLLVVVAVAGVPFMAAGQSGRTTTVRGVVVDVGGMPVENSRVAVHPVLGKKIEAAAKGEFEVEAPAIGSELLLSARNETGELQGMVMFSVRQAEPVRVTLRKARELIVTVTDPAQQPIAGARVGADVGNSFQRQGTIAEDVTNGSGRVVLRFPAEATLQSLFAVKREVGINYSLLPVGPLEPQTIVLGDNATIPMRVVDDEDKPLAGVSIRPATLGRSIFPLREFEEVRSTTDAMGEATLRMLPAAIIARIQFDVELEDYAVIQAMRYDPRVAPKELIARLAPLVMLRGKVTGADGKPPAARTEIYAAGAGYHPQEPSGTYSIRWGSGDTGVFFQTVCDESAAFELRVARNQYYALLACVSPRQEGKDNIVSPIQVRVVGNGPPAEEPTFRLGPATRIHGIATRSNGRQVTPVGSATMELAWRDAESYAKLPIEQRLPNPEGKMVEIVAELRRLVLTDQDGKFEFCRVAIRSRRKRTAAGRRRLR